MTSAGPNGATYFELTDWDEIKRVLTLDQIWKINLAFLKQQLADGKDFVLSHPPAKARNFYQKEIIFLSVLFSFDEEGSTWKAKR